jgi:hypothetical protein
LATRKKNAAPPDAIDPWQEEEHVRRLKELCQSRVEPPDDRRRGPASQLPERRREDALRGNVAQLADDLHEQGRSFLDISDLLGLAKRTLRSWCADFRDGLADDTPRCVPLGRPAIRSPRDERSAVLAVLDELGPATGLPTLRECFPFMPRAELEDLLRRYRRVWRRRYHYAPRILRWQTPSAVWAMDYSQAPAPIDGSHPHLLAVRDLASGQQLLASRRTRRRRPRDRRAALAVRAARRAAGPENR